MKYIKLYNGIELPMIGYGTLQISPDQVKQCVLNALDAGYRLMILQQPILMKKVLEKP